MAYFIHEEILAQKKKQENLFISQAILVAK